MAPSTDEELYLNDFDFAIIIAHASLSKLTLHQDHHTCPNQMFSYESWTSSRRDFREKY